MTQLGLSIEDQNKLLKTKKLCLKAGKSLKNYSDRINSEKNRTIESLKKVRDYTQTNQ